MAEAHPSSLGVERAPVDIAFADFKHAFLNGGQ